MLRPRFSCFFISRAGRQLLTTTIEENPAVVEVLLSAVSPMELMAGKLAGQMAASLIGMAVYVIMCMALLASFALFGMLDLSLIFYLLIFFFIAYFVMGSLMMAVGAAVNDMGGSPDGAADNFRIPWIL
jgi:ABC-type Na+ efflux pump permease subunit